MVGAEEDGFVVAMGAALKRALKNRWFNALHSTLLNSAVN